MRRTEEEKNLLAKLASGVLDGMVGDEREYRGYRSVFCGKYILQFFFRRVNYRVSWYSTKYFFFNKTVTEIFSWKLKRNPVFICFKICFFK